MTSNSFTLSIILSILILGCTSISQDKLIEDADYCKNTADYLIELGLYTNNHNYLIGSFDYCHPCLNNSIKFVADNKDKISNLTILVSGQNIPIDVFKELQNSTDIEVKFDTKNMAQEFDIGIYKPLLVTYSDNECGLHVRLNSDNLSDVISRYLIRDGGL